MIGMFNTAAIGKLGSLVWGFSGERGFGIQGCTCFRLFQGHGQGESWSESPNPGGELAPEVRSAVSAPVEEP